MSKDDVHVFKNEEDKWATKSNEATKAAGLFNTQKEAIDRAKEIAANKKSDVVIHGVDGKIRSKDSYGRDPNPPKDREH